MTEEGGRALKSGNSYLFTDAGVPRAFGAFKRLLSEGRRGLVITRAHPSRVQQLYGLDCPIMWIAKTTTPSGVMTLEPTRLMKIHGTISDFMKANPGSVVLLDGLEYLVTENGFAPVMKALQLTNEEVAMSGSYLIIPLDPRTMESQQLGFLEREFTLPEERDKKLYGPSSED